MKKILVLVLTLALAIGNTCACLAESPIDFSGYSLEELLEIRENLTNEISSRPGGEKMVLGSGQYKIGDDLPAGVYTFKFVQNGDSDVSRTEYDMPRVEGSLKGDGETRISLYPGEYLSLRYNGAEIARVGNVSERGSYDVPSGTSIPKGNYTIGEEIPAGTYKIYFGGSTTSRVRVFQDADEASNTFNKGKETILDWNNTEGTVTLTDGNILRVEYMPIIMTKGGGFTFD